MKFLALLYGSPTTWSQAQALHAHMLAAASDRAAMRTEHDALYRDIAGSGELLTSEPLAHPATARIIQFQADTTVITHGPLGGSEHQLAGYLLLDCESLDRATGIAARLLDAHTHTVEIRPIMTLAGLETYS